MVDRNTDVPVDSPQRNTESLGDFQVAHAIETAEQEHLARGPRQPRKAELHAPERDRMFQGAHAGEISASPFVEFCIFDEIRHASSSPSRPIDRHVGCDAKEIAARVDDLLGVLQLEQPEIGLLDDVFGVVHSDPAAHQAVERSAIMSKQMIYGPLRPAHRGLPSIGGRRSAQIVAGAALRGAVGRADAFCEHRPERGRRMFTRQRKGRFGDKTLLMIEHRRSHRRKKKMWRRTTLRASFDREANERSEAEVFGNGQAGGARARWARSRKAIDK
nr:hypothetical protein [Methylosinus sp. Ce-a6]